MDKYQWKNKSWVEKLKYASNHNKYFCVGEKDTHIICRSEKMLVLTILQKYVVNWYHT